jgi:hypothetical protein
MQKALAILSLIVLLASCDETKYKMTESGRVILVKNEEKPQGKINHEKLKALARTMREKGEVIDEKTRQRRQAEEAEKRVVEEKKRAAEKRMREDRAKLVKEYQLEERPLMELISLAHQARAGSDIHQLLDEVIQSRVPTYLATLGLEELKALGAGEVECPTGGKPYLGYNSAQTDVWVKTVNRQTGGYDYLLALYLQSDNRWLLKEVENIVREKATSSSLGQNLADLQKFAEQAQEGPRDSERIKALVKIKDELLEQQILGLPEQEASLSWQYLKALKSAGLTEAKSYVKLRDMLNANSSSLEESVELSNY